MANLYIKINKIDLTTPNPDLMIRVENSDGETWASLEEFHKDFPPGKGEQSWDSVILTGALITRDKSFIKAAQNEVFLRCEYTDDQGHTKMIVIVGKKGTCRFSLDPAETEMPRYKGRYRYEFICEGDSVEEVITLLDMDEQDRKIT